MTATLVLDRAELKAATTETGTRTLDFYAAAFSAKPDSNNDIIDPEAANEWLQEFYAEGKALPISFAHSAMWDMTDPGRFIGYAPADTGHVWIDDYGVRVKALLNTDADGAMGENARAAARLVDQSVVGGASITYIADKTVQEKSGVRRITKLRILEAGPCLVPANPDAVILGIKTADGRLIVAEKAASAQSVDATLELILGAEDVAAIEEQPEEAELKGSFEEQTEVGESKLAPPYMTVDEFRAKNDLPPLPAGDGGDMFVPLSMKHAFSPRHIQGAHDALVRAGAKCVLGEEGLKSETPAEIDENAERLRRLRFLKTSLI